MGKSSKKKPICKVGDRISGPGRMQGTVEHTAYTSVKPYKIRWDNGLFGIYSAKDFDKYQYSILSPEITVAAIEEQQELLWHQFGIEDIEESTASELSGSTAKQCLKPSVCSQDKVDLRKPQNSLEALMSPKSLKLTQMHKPSYGQIFQDYQSTETSEPTNPQPESLMSVGVDFLAPELVERETERDSITQNQPCAESFCDASVKQSLSSYSSNNLWDLSIEDLEHGLEEQQWQDTRASIRLSLHAINLERNLKGEESLSFPTLLSGRGRGCRDAGLTKCEVWFKQNVIQDVGLQLSAEAIASLHGFPANWYRAISPPSVAQPVTQDGLQLESWEDKPFPFPKPELLLNGSNGCGQNFPREWQIGSSEKVKSEEELTPRGSSAVGNHFWCERLAVLVEVLDVREWGELIKEAICRPWWTKDEKGHVLFEDTLVLLLAELVEQKEFSCPVPHRSPDKLNCRDSFSLGKLHPSQWLVGDRFVADSPDAIPYQVMEIKRQKIKLKFDNCNGGWYEVEGLIPWCAKQIFLGNVGRSPEPKFSLGKSQTDVSRQVGYLTQYTSDRKGKDKILRSYPLVSGSRDKFTDTHWYWNFSYKEKDPDTNLWVSRSAAVKRSQLAAVRKAIADGKPYTYTLKEILGK